jgi:formate dehydrogenase major subunit
VKETREKTFVREKEGKRVNHTLGIATLGGATFAVEENYLLGKLFHSLGVVSIENQARI